MVTGTVRVNELVYIHSMPGTSAQTSPASEVLCISHLGIHDVAGSTVGHLTAYHICALMMLLAVQ